MVSFAISNEVATSFTPVAYGEAVLALLKEGSSGVGSRLVVPVNGTNGTVLRPVATKPGQIDPVDVRCLTEWRNRYPRAFLTEFESTPERTTTWLANHVRHDRGRILFMVVNAAGKPLGYIGLAYIDWSTGRGEADAIVSGGEAPRGTMKNSLLTLLRWSMEQLGLRQLFVRVLADNPAVEFYRRLGFIEVGMTPLICVDTPHGRNWVEDQLGASIEKRNLIKMQWQPPDESLVTSTRGQPHNRR